MPSLRQRALERRRRTGVLFVIIVTLVTVALSTASAQDHRKPANGPMPEPLIAESVTDIDSDSRGELEFDVTSGFARSRKNGADGGTLEAEVEWRATRRLGLSLEVDADRSRTSRDSPRDTNVTGRFATSWILLHDFAKDLHLQLETGARIGPGEKIESLAPSGLRLPYFAGFRLGMRGNLWTLRSGVGVSFGGGASFVGALALFRETVSKAGRQSFFGIEFNADTARRRPLEIDPEVVLGLPTRSLPLHLGAAFLWSPSHDRSGSSVGALLRLIVETDRD